LDEKGLRKISSTIQNETRKFNLREGLDPKEDTLPKRFFDEPPGKDGKTSVGRTSDTCSRITTPRGNPALKGFFELCCILRPLD
jgi:aldehyde:ferredoxin oxidoreductase